MASLPSVAVSGTPKPDLDFRRSPQHSLSTEKNTSISYQRKQTATSLNNYTDPRSLGLSEALSLLNEGAKNDTTVYVPLLQQCIDNYSASEAEIVHTHIVKIGAHEDLFLMTFLLNVYSKCGMMDYAQSIFDKMPKTNVVTRTALITGYIRNSQPELSVQVFKELLESGCYPTNYTLAAVLSACSSLRATKLGQQIHGYIVKYQIESDISIGNSLCSLYSKCRCFDLAVKVFRRIPEKNVVSWTTMISACGDNDKPEMGLEVFVEMVSEDAELNEFTISSVLSLCCLAQASEFGEQIHSLSIKRGYVADIPLKTSIMYMYLRSGRTEDARKLFSSMEVVNLVTWNAMISGFSQIANTAKDVFTAQHSATEALKLFHKLHQSNLKPDFFTFSSILTACCVLVAIVQGEQIHAQTIKTGSLAEVVLGSALVNMYNKCGSVDKATKAFLEMPIRTVISWTSMIACYAQHGQSQLALQLFEDMRLAGERPNKITFIAVFSACNHAGKVNEGLRYFKMMKKEYKIKPVMEHYASLIDMFVRLGQLQQAFDLVKKMEFEPNEFIWSVLVAGCRSHGNMELGHYAAERLLELKPKNPETYVMLSNMYLAAERWDDLSKVRKLMQDEKIGKLKDWSSITIKDKVHSFKADDRSNIQSPAMYELLNDLLDKATIQGYVPLKSLEMPGEEDKTFSTTHHSEKLAIAFGLLNTPSKASIRILKSISICGDCHSLIKHISTLTEREIIVRDSKRLHLFKDGHCSCGDFSGLH